MYASNLHNPNVTESNDINTTLKENLLPGETLLITSPGFTRRGVTPNILEGVADRVHLLDDVSSHPQLEQINNWFEKLKGGNVANVIGLGGGSVIDVSKILTGLLASPHFTFEEVMTQQLALPRSNTKLLVIPTTAGTGAEVTAFATIWDLKKGKKHSINCAKPDLVIFEPGLLFSLPPDVVLYSALDAISHAVESLWNVNRDKLSEQLAIQALTALIDGVPKVLQNANDREAWKQVQWAAFKAGAAINITKTAIAHAISYPLTIHYEIPHGLACSFTIKAIIEDVGPARLKIPVDLADKLVKLLSSLRLSDEMARYQNWQDIFVDNRFYLEPSRCENFIASVDSKWAKNIALKSG